MSTLMRDKECDVMVAAISDRIANTPDVAFQDIIVSNLLSRGHQSARQFGTYSRVVRKRMSETSRGPLEVVRNPVQNDRCKDLIGT